MVIDWNEVQNALVPIKDYEACCRRFEEVFVYSFARTVFNYPMLSLIDYTQELLLGDSKGRYVGYYDGLATAMSVLNNTGVKDVIDLADRTATRERLAAFVSNTQVPVLDIITVLKFLVYWFIPGQKYLGGLVQVDPELILAISALRTLGIRTNLDMLSKGITPSNRKQLSEESGQLIGTITELANRADFSRLPWTSKATISNIIGAGYPSLAALANADPAQLYSDFMAYGQKIGKNLKLGNEIENSYRIARIVPVILERDDEFN